MEKDEEEEKEGEGEKEKKSIWRPMFFSEGINGINMMDNWTKDEWNGLVLGVDLRIQNMKKKNYVKLTPI